MYNAHIDISRNHLNVRLERVVMLCYSPTLISVRKRHSN